MIKLRCFRHVESKDNNDWVKRITWEVEGIRQTGHPRVPGGIMLRMISNV